MLELAPELAPIWVQRGHMLKEAGKRDDARDAYKKALEIEPENADTHLQLGHLFKLMEDRPSAVEMYRSALEIDPALTDAAAELKRLGVRARPANLVRSAKASSRKAILYFDVTDLLVYFRENRTPTGIQRISVAVTEAALADSGGREVGLCAVDTATGVWKPVDANAFKFAMMLSREGADNSRRTMAKGARQASQRPRIIARPGLSAGQHDPESGLALGRFELFRGGAGSEAPVRRILCRLRARHDSAAACRNSAKARPRTSIRAGSRA